LDLTYRNDLRAINDTNFARFEAVLEAGLTQVELRLVRRLGEFTNRMEERFLEHERGFRSFRQEVESRFFQHLRWMIGLWMTTTVGVLAMLVAILRQGG
jgi:hypothetical protein